MPSLLADSDRPELGMFGPDRPIWLLCRHRSLFLGIAPVLVYQVSHPMVAAGVDEHSSYVQDATRRLRTTLGTMIGLVYGDADALAAARERVRERHQHVRGTMGSAVDPSADVAGRPYDARDPVAKRWVHATFLFGIVHAYEHTVGPIHPSWHAPLWEDFRRIGAAFKVPADQLPNTWDEARGWYEECLEAVNTPGSVLRVGRTARHHAHHIFDGPLTRTPLDEMLALILLHPRFVPLVLERRHDSPWRRRVGDALLGLARGFDRWAPRRWAWAGVWFDAMTRVGADWRRAPRDLSSIRPVEIGSR